MKKLLIGLVCLAALPAWAQNSSTMNPFDQPFGTLHETAPYSKIRAEHFIPAIQKGIEAGKKDIEQIKKNPAKPTFVNTIVALENAGKSLGRVTRVMNHLNGSETTPDIQAAVRQAAPLLTEYSNDVSLDPVLFQRVKAVWDGRAGLKLDKEDAMLLEKTYKSFARNGAALQADAQTKLREVNKALSLLSLQFSENILHATNAYKLHITDETRIGGLPDFVKEGARATAKKASLEGYVFTLQAPSYGPFMQYAEDRELRKELFLAFSSRGFKGDQHDNQANIQKIVQLRYEKAQLLGYETWADYILEERMANSKTIVWDFLQDIQKYAEPAAIAEIKELTAFAQSLGFAEPQLQRWDVAFYSEKLKKEKYAINDEILKPYFKLENVLDGIFTLATRLYGITFKLNPTIEGWHEDVRAYEVIDKNGKLLAVWYGDYFPRPGKRAGAWNNSVQGQWIQAGQDIRPHVVNVCNFSKPTETKPSLLTFYEVTTLFHEFGHALHAMMAAGKYASLSGTSVAWDFVELPSQIMENFAEQPEVLRMFARHYQTGEVIPQDLIDKLRASANFMSGSGTMRQLGMGMLDMTYHSTKPSGESILEIEKKADIGARLYPRTEGTATSTAFSHIFAGGYSAGYYSYKWSEVLDADAFELFKEKGIFNQEVAESFRKNILSAGGTEKPMELYKKFRGREPKTDAMLRRSGLLQ